MNLVWMFYKEAKGRDSRDLEGIYHSNYTPHFNSSKLGEFRGEEEMEFSYIYINSDCQCFLCDANLYHFIFKLANEGVKVMAQ